MNIEIKAQRNIEWKKPSKDSSVMKGIFEVSGKKYQITVSYPSKEFDDDLQQKIEENFEDINPGELAKLSNYTLSTTLEDLGKKEFKVIKGENVDNNWKQDTDIKDTVNKIQNIFSNIFTSPEINKKSIPKENKDISQKNMSISFEKLEHPLQLEHKTLHQAFKKEIKIEEKGEIIQPSESHKTQALKIHNKNKYFFKKPVIDLKTGITTCTKKQFKSARKLLSENFSNELKSYKKKELNIIGSQLLQLILTGEFTQLEDENCFALNDLTVSKTSGEKIDDLGNSFPSYALKSFLGKEKANQFGEKEIEPMLAEITKQFEKDCINRPGLKLLLKQKITENEKEKIIEIGGKNPSPLFISQTMEAYAAYLEKNPLQVKETLDNLQHSDLYNLLQQSKDLNFDQINQKFNFSENTFLKILKQGFIPHLPKSGNNEILARFGEYALNNVIVNTPLNEIAEKIAIEKKLETSQVLQIIEENWNIEDRKKFTYLQEVIFFSRLNNKTRDSLIEKTKLSADEIESMFRWRSFEMMLFINQGVAPPILNQPISTIGQNYPQGFPPGTGIRIFEFSKDFNYLNARIDWKLRIPQDSEPIDVAKTQSHLLIPMSSTKNSEKAIMHVLANPLFNWKTTDDYIEYLNKLFTSKEFLKQKTTLRD